MATRFFLPSTGASAVNPGFDAGWESFPAADRLKCVTTRINSAMTNASRNGSGVSGQDILTRQYVSDPINAQSISGTVQAMIRCNENAAANNIQGSIVYKVVSNNGSSVTGVLLASFNIGTEWATVLGSKGFPLTATAITTVAANAGDRIVAEYGFRQTSTNVVAQIMNFGDNSATDLGTAEAEATANNPWFQLSTTITFQSTVTRPRSTVISRAVSRAANW